MWRGFVVVLDENNGWSGHRGSMLRMILAARWLHVKRTYGFRLGGVLTGTPEPSYPQLSYRR